MPPRYLVEVQCVAHPRELTLAFIDIGEIGMNATSLQTLPLAVTPFRCGLIGLVLLLAPLHHVGHINDKHQTAVLLSLLHPVVQSLFVWMFKRPQ